MKSLFILASLALGVSALNVPAEGLEARQQGQVCQWTGHCIGDRCNTENDCDLDYICRNQRCASPNTVPATTARTTARVTTIRTTVRPGTTARPGTTTGRRTTTVYVTAPRPTSTARPGQPQPQPQCEWEGHCLGASCNTENDCDGQLACVNRRCANPPGQVVTSTRPGNNQPPVTRITTQPRPTQGGGRTPSCGDNPLACIGVSCRSDADCGFDLIVCKNGLCGL
ncbi:hypothetical protein B0T16DRAFT_457481 [Cercophora newfieldiana]|uniref:Uncharacterized protein n=1 Tax=Cercophora newfieldiana TaxID=92897 RepID=A0AA39Y6L0_9PEZI|nr:hypothetical protein B0T16DRAFT_457481 [Cercophora newfieldiana]